MTDFADWIDFNYQQATVQLWVFKKSTANTKFRAWHVRTDSEIEALFRQAVLKDITNTTEEIRYSPISQNNESSCLTHRLEDSEGLIALLNLVNKPEAENIDAELKHLKGAAGYLVKFQHERRTVYAIRRTAPSWRPQVKKSFINAIFLNGELSVKPEATFSFEAQFDFYCINETIFVKSKRAFESTMSEKKIYEKSFEALTADPGFISIFSDLQPLKDYVGTNAIQLRRISVIQNKALYLLPDFPQRIQLVNNTRNYGLNFDVNGKLIVCANTVKTIMQILLDHRLLSEITETIYDVPDTETV